MSPACQFRAAFDLTRSEAAILAELHRAGSAWISADRLNERTADASSHYDHAAPLRCQKSVAVHIQHIRTKLGADSILSYWGRGYTLGALGVVLCRQAIAPESGSLRRSAFAPGSASGASRIAGGRA